MQLCKGMGRHEAHQLLYQAAQRAQTEGLPFITALREHPRFAAGGLPAAVAQALDAEAYLGASAAITVETVGRVTSRKVPMNSQR
jgi:3-carboxy-cis,cis-muconate cycloisomerase